MKTRAMSFTDLRKRWEEADSRVNKMICKNCAIYERDDENPVGGLGDCEVNRRNPRQVAIQHNDQLHYHSNLIYPSATGCSQWKEKRDDDVEKE